MKKTALTNLEVPRSLPRGRHGLSRELVRASQRSRLMDAMAELTAEKGYAAVTIGDVAVRGGVAKRTFYDYFADKEACFLAAGEHLAEQIAEAITIPHDPDLDLYSRAEATIRGLLRLLSDHPSYGRAFIVEVWAAGPRAIRFRLEVDRQLALLLAELSHDVSRHQSDARAVSESHGVAVIGAIGGHIYRIVYFEGAKRLMDHVETLAKLATGLLMADLPRLNGLKSKADLPSNTRSKSKRASVSGR